jgi:hypothetical protein
MKSTITWTWIGGLVVFAAGIGVSIVGVFLMLALQRNVHADRQHQ